MTRSCLIPPKLDASDQLERYPVLDRRVFHVSSPYRRVPGRVAPGDCSPRAPTDPYVPSRAYGSSRHGLAVRDPLLFRGHGHGFRCTRHVSLQRCHDMASPSLHGVPRDGSPASAILWDAPTPRRPSRPASNSSRADTTVSPVICSPRSWASHRGPGSCRFRSPHPELRWKRRGLSGSLETLMVIVRALRPRQDQAG